MIGGKLKCDIVEVAGIMPSLWGMRNPLNSHHKFDSFEKKEINYIEVGIGENDLDLAKRLTKAGTEHRKFLRQIQVWLEVRVPRYLWQEIDTYKFGTKNSESTMHTIQKHEFTIDDFYLGDDPIIMTANHLEIHVIPLLNQMRELYFEGDLEYRWKVEMKRVIPESYLQTRMWNTNYEELANIYYQRKNHRLKEEWGVILRTIEELPYFQEIILDTLNKRVE